MAHPIFCDVCNIGVSSEVSMRDHVKGRRHQQTLGAMERRKAMARNSLYCHGFPPSIPTADLRTYFQRFGPVTRIMVETQKGCYCIVQYDTESPVQKALGQRNHQLHGCSLTVRPRKPITPHRRPSEAERSQRKARASQEEEDQADSSHEHLMGALLQAESVLAQMEMLYETMRLSDADLERRKSVCDYLYSVLNPFFPTCSIHQFGSSVNGFGLKGCDMDIFLDLHDTDVSLQREETLRHKLKPVNLPYIREIQSLKTTEGPLMPSQLRQLSLVHRVKLMSRILMQHAHHCVEVLFVPSVRCPIVRFVHSPTGIKCDLSINNRLALRNTQLLKMCAEDRRVRLLVFAVRYWGKWKQVAGNQNCGPRLSNYCLSLLVLFCLTHTSPPLLPSVQALADMAGPDQKCVIEDWDCSLPETLQPSTNTEPAAGTVKSLNDFLMEKVTCPHLSDFKVKALAVQDPFVLQHNIAQNINNQVRDHLIQEIGFASAKTSTWSSTDSASAAPQTSQSADSQVSQPLWGLPYLFSTQDCKPPSEESAVAASASSSWCQAGSRAKGAPLPPSSQWTFSVSLDLFTLSAKALESLRSKGDYRVMWFRRVATLLEWALQEVFLFRVETDKGGCASDDGESFVEGEERMCVDDEEEGRSQSQCCAAETSDSDIAGSRSSFTGSTVAGSKLSGGSQETMIAESSSAEGPAGSVDPDLVKLSSGNDGSRVDSPGAGEEVGESGVAQSPHSARSSPMPSPSRASPMSELSPHAGEERRSPPKGEAVTAPPPQCWPPDAGVVEPCSQLAETCPAPESRLSGGEGSPPLASACCDVEMTADSLAALPALNTVDSSTVLGLRRDGPNSCSVGEAAVASGNSVLPLRVEFNRVGDGKVYVSSENEAGSSLSDAATPSADLLSSKTTTTTTPPPRQQSPKKDTHENSGSSPVPKSDKCRPFRVYCEGKHKAWYGRKATRSNLIAEGHADNLELEKLISSSIAERDAESTAPPLKFYCTLSPVAKGDRPEGEVTFEPAGSLPKEFSVFSTFFRSYFTKLVSKNVIESDTV
ncbi:hypothetical protein ACOMHN_041022 [Nucella lapillus]